MKQVTFKISEIKAIANMAAYLMGLKLTPSAANKLSWWAKPFVKEMDEISKHENEMIRRYVPEGEERVPSDKMPAYSRDAEEFLNEQRTVEFKSFKIEWLDGTADIQSPSLLALYLVTEEPTDN